MSPSQGHIKLETIGLKLIDRSSITGYNDHYENGQPKENRMSQVTGTVENVSTKWGKYSIQVNGSWYGTKEEWAKVKPDRGDKVTFDDGGKNYMKNVTITDKGSGSPSSGSKKVYSNLGVELGHASKLAMDVVLNMPANAKRVGSAEFYKEWLAHTDTIYRTMSHLRKSYEDESLKPIPLGDSIFDEKKPEERAEKSTEISVEDIF